MPKRATCAQFNELLIHLDDARVIDAAVLQRFDTTTLALLLEGQRRAVRSGRPLKVINAPARLLEMARLHGVKELLFSEMPSDGDTHFSDATGT